MKASVFNQNNQNKQNKMCLVNLKYQKMKNIILMMMTIIILLPNQLIKVAKVKNGAKKQRINLRKNCH